MDLKNFIIAVSQIAEEKGISVDKVIEAVEGALAAAYKKEYGRKGQTIRAKIDQKTGEVKFWQVKQVLDKNMILTEEEIEELKKKKEEGKEEIEENQKNKKIRFNPEKHILEEEAKKIDPNLKAGEELLIPLEVSKDFGRIAAQTAKQVVLQKLKEAEKESLYQEFKEKEDKIVSGIIQRVEERNVFIDLGKITGILPKDEQIPGEFYRIGQRLKTYVLRVEATPKGPKVILSRAYPKFISRLFEMEVPEIVEGQVKIVSLAREPGSRTKIAVKAESENIDPIGSMVGQKGTRVMAVINELGGEKIDIVEYSDDPETYIANALSPAKVLEVRILPKNVALAIVPNDQLSLAIGREGQNVRLAVKLTGWKIEVRTQEDLENNPDLEKEIENSQEIEKEDENTLAESLEEIKESKEAEEERKEKEEDKSALEEEEKTKEEVEEKDKKQKEKEGNDEGEDNKEESKEENVEKETKE